MKLLLVPVLISVALAQVAEKANSGYKTPDGREQVARTLIAPDRAAKRNRKNWCAMLLGPEWWWPILVLAPVTCCRS
jgi:hypothetical protein